MYLYISVWDVLGNIMYVHLVLYWDCVASHVTLWMTVLQDFPFTDYCCSPPGVLDQWQQTYVLSWVTGIPTSICHSWLDDHRRYAGRRSVTVWGTSGYGKTMGLLSLASVHILEVNNQAVPRTVHTIIQNYRCRIKREIIKTAWIYRNVPDFSALIPRHGVPGPWHTGI
jgi:hypothetical protein